MFCCDSISCIAFQDDIDMELATDSPEENAIPKEVVKREVSDPKQNLQLLLQRQAKFLENCRDVKVSRNFIICDFFVWDPFY